MLFFVSWWLYILAFVSISFLSFFCFIFSLLFAGKTGLDTGLSSNCYLFLAVLYDRITGRSCKMNEPFNTDPPLSTWPPDCKNNPLNPFQAQSSGPRPEMTGASDPPVCNSPESAEPPTWLLCCARATAPPLIREFRMVSLESDPCRLSLLLLFPAWRGIRFFSPQDQWAYAAPPSPVCTVDPVLPRRNSKISNHPHILLNIITI